MTDGLLSLKVYSAAGLTAEIDQISAVNIRLDNGILLGIRPGHAPLIASSVKGDLEYLQEGKKQTLMVNPGILTVANNLIKILTTD